MQTKEHDGGLLLIVCREKQTNLVMTPPYVL